MTAHIATSSASAASASMLASGKKLLPFLHISGLLGAAFFFLALLSLGDALQSLLRQDFNRIDVVAGEEVLISGALPANVTSLADIEVRITGEAAVLFTPVDTYRGFWLGGNMWRATVTANANAKSSEAVLTIVDLMPQKKGKEETQILEQNGSLVYPLYVWSSAGEKDKASHSALRRFFGINAFAVAALCTLSALFVTGINSLLGRDIEKKLGKACVYMLHGRKREKNGYVISFPSPPSDLSLDKQIYLYDRRWRLQASGEVVEVSKQVTKALVPLTTSPQFGWFISYHKI